MQPLWRLRKCSGKWSLCSSLRSAPYPEGDPLLRTRGAGCRASGTYQRAVAGRSRITNTATTIGKTIFRLLNHLSWSIFVFRSSGVVSARMMGGWIRGISAIYECGNSDGSQKRRRKLSVGRSP